MIMTLRDGLDIHLWHIQNYPKDDLTSAMLGLGEEIGELMRAELKQSGGIRGTWDEWQTEKKKEAGDVMIALINCCGYSGINLGDVFDAAPTLTHAKAVDHDYTDYVFWSTWRGQYLPGNSKTALLRIGQTFGTLINGDDDQRPLNGRVAATLLLNVEYYCRLNKINPEEALNDRWRTISARNFITNPLTGGREHEH